MDLDQPRPPAQRRLAAPVVPDDTGAVDPAVAEALARHGADPADPTAYAAAMGAVARSRLLVPVVAIAGEVEVDAAGLAHDKTSDMAAVLLTSSGGRTALLAFTGTEPMARWDPTARPVPVAASTAAQAALQDGAAALLVDVAGPARLVVEGDDLRALARGWQLAVVEGRVAWIGPGPE